jgi:hypothetical protein
MSAEIAAMKEAATSVIVNDPSVDHLRSFQFGGAAHCAVEERG